MPIIDVTYPVGTLNSEAQTAVAAQLTDILMDIEGTKGKANIAAGTWLVLNEVGQNAIAAGGQLTPGLVRVVVSVPTGGLKIEQKEALIQRVTDAVIQIQGIEPDARTRAKVYCLINEINDGGWGFAGVQFTRERLIALSSKQ